MTPQKRDSPYGLDPSGNPLDRFGLSRPVWLLGWVSFFTDMASEMIYPLLPLFLTRVLGAGAMSLGVIEGVAEAANSILKIVSGRMADRTGQPKKLVLAGYGLSSLVRPLIGFVTAWPHVLALRFTDRIGKGVRTSPRDALLARFAPEKTRGCPGSSSSCCFCVYRTNGPIKSLVHRSLGRRSPVLCPWDRASTK